MNEKKNTSYKQIARTLVDAFMCVHYNKPYSNIASALVKVPRIGFAICAAIETIAQRAKTKTQHLFIQTKIFATFFYLFVASSRAPVSLQLCNIFVYCCESYTFFVVPFWLQQIKTNEAGNMYFAWTIEFEIVFFAFSIFVVVIEIVFHFLLFINDKQTSIGKTQFQLISFHSIDWHFLLN